MTIVVTVKVTDGLVLAADSAATFYVPTAGGQVTKIYNHANKVFNLRKVWPVGAMVYGAGGIGASSVETLTKDLRRRFSDKKDKAYYLPNRRSFTIGGGGKKGPPIFIRRDLSQNIRRRPSTQLHTGLSRMRLFCRRRPTRNLGIPDRRRQLRSALPGTSSRRLRPALGRRNGSA